MYIVINLTRIGGNSMFFKRLFLNIVFFLVFNKFFIGIETKKIIIMAIVSYCASELISYVLRKFKRTKMKFDNKKN